MHPMLNNPDALPPGKPDPVAEFAPELAPPRSLRFEAADLPYEVSKAQSDLMAGVGLKLILDFGFIGIFFDVLDPPNLWLIVPIVLCSLPAMCYAYQLARFMYGRPAAAAWACATLLPVFLGSLCAFVLSGMASWRLSRSGTASRPTGIPR
jgi:hypothetical protein